MDFVPDRFGPGRVVPDRFGPDRVVPDRFGPGRVWTECVPPRTEQKLLGQEVTGRTRMLGPRMVEARQTG